MREQNPQRAEGTSRKSHSWCSGCWLDWAHGLIAFHVSPALGGRLSLPPRHLTFSVGCLSRRQLSLPLDRLRSRFPWHRVLRPVKVPDDAGL